MSKLLKSLIIAVLVFNTLPGKAIHLPEFNEYKGSNEFIGNWKIKSVVTESNCPYVIVGSTTKSEIKIRKDLEKMTATWEGGNWTNSRTYLKALSQNEIITERVTEMKGKGNTKWAAILVEHIYIDGNGEVHSESYVKQYKNDKFVGDYKTYSILLKASN